MAFTTEGHINYIDYNINESLAVNDLLWCTCTTPAGGENWNNSIGASINWGVVTKIKSTKIGFNHTAINSPGFPTSTCAGTWFVSFTKNAAAEKSSIKGYYNLVNFVNDDNWNEAELFMVNSEVTPSSK
jgi:hypothetical protein